MKLQAILKSKLIITMITFCSLTAITLSSCVKKASDANANLGFIGLWSGASCTGATVYTISAGSSSSSIQITEYVGVDTCMKLVEVQCTVGGNYLTCPTQTFTDNCSNAYIISATGDISGSTISVANNVNGYTCSFAGSN